MHGRGFFAAATYNAPADTFDNPDSVMFAGKSADDLLLNISFNYKFVGYTILDHYGLHDIFGATDVTAGIEDYTTHIDKQLATFDATVVGGVRPASPS